MCRILAIETSCDETAAAVVEGGKTILSNVVSSQSDIHERFGGVVPEVASRKHVEQITMVIEQALIEANMKKEDLSAIAVTQGPGLVGALLIGLMAAKALAMSLRLPLIAVHHIAGHIYANELVEPLHYPSMALVVSGGHTELIRMPQEGRFERIGQTRDDAVGEAYDKVARTLELPYPGGPPIDKLAQSAEEAIELPRAWLEPDSFDFSFSGLKSAVMNVVNQGQMKGNPPNKAYVAKGFQDSIVEVLVEKSIRAVRMYEMDELVLAGGVAANRGLRQALEIRCAQEGIRLRIPPFYLCTDNAAMIGAAAYIKWKQNDFSSLDIQARPSFSLAEWQKTAAGS